MIFEFSQNSCNSCVELFIDCLKLRFDVWDNFIGDLDLDDIEDLCDQCGQFVKDIIWRIIDASLNAIANFIPNVLICGDGLFELCYSLFNLGFKVVLIDPWKVSEFFDEVNAGFCDLSEKLGNLEL